MEGPTLVGGNIPIWFLFVLLGGYAVSRTPYFSIAAVTIILLLSVPSFLVALSLEEPTSIRLMAAMISAPRMVCPETTVDMALAFRLWEGVGHRNQAQPDALDLQELTDGVDAIFATVTAVFVAADR